MIVLARCGQCRAWSYPPRATCRVCLSDDLAPAEHPGGAVVIAAAIVRRTLDPAWQNRLPLPVVTVLLDGGPQMIATGSAPPGARVALRYAGGLFHAEERE